MAHILVVEDDEAIRRYDSILLAAEQHTVVTAASGHEALAAVELGAFDVILLDIGLPDMLGIDLCKRLRARTDTPIIFVSSRQDEIDKVLALDAGGDDYITKPFTGGELSARIRVALRHRPAAAVATGERLEAAGIILDGASHRMFVRSAEVMLTPKEFELLRLLMASAGRTLERQHILDRVWGADFYGDTSALDVYIRQLRRKIEQDPAQPHLIETVRGVGFRFIVP